MLLTLGFYPVSGAEFINIQIHTENYVYFVKSTQSVQVHTLCWLVSHTFRLKMAIRETCLFDKPKVESRSRISELAQKPEPKICV